MASNNNNNEEEKTPENANPKGLFDFTKLNYTPSLSIDPSFLQPKEPSIASEKMKFSLPKRFLTPKKPKKDVQSFEAREIPARFNTNCISFKPTETSLSLSILMKADLDCIKYYEKHIDPTYLGIAFSERLQKRLLVSNLKVRSRELLEKISKISPSLRKCHRPEEEIESIEKAVKELSERSGVKEEPFKTENQTTDIPAFVCFSTKMRQQQYSANTNLPTEPTQIFQGCEGDDKEEIFNMAQSQSHLFSNPFAQGIVPQPIQDLVLNHAPQGVSQSGSTSGPPHNVSLFPCFLPWDKARFNYGVDPELLVFSEDEKEKRKKEKEEAFKYFMEILDFIEKLLPFFAELIQPLEGLRNKIEIIEDFISNQNSK